MNTPHSANFGKLVTATTALKTSLPLGRADKLETKLVPAIAKQVAQTKGPIKKLYETAYNSCVSMVEGLRDGEATHVDYQEFVAEMATLQNKATVIEMAALKKSGETAIKYSHGLDPDSWNHNDYQDRRRSEQQEERYLEGNRQVIQKYKKYELLVPRSLEKKFSAKRLPVVALTNPGLSREVLTSLKMLADTFFGYPILKDQLVLGLNSDWIISEYKRDTQEAINDVLSVFHQETGKRYFPLGEPKKRALVDWVWLVTDVEMRKLNKSSVSGHFALKAWSFPFEADDIIRKPAPEQK